jgi:hypothetical protein
MPARTRWALALAAVATAACSTPGAARRTRAAEAPEPEPGTEWTLALGSRVDFWKVGLEAHEHMLGGGSNTFWDPVSLASASARPGPFLGPRLEVRSAALFGRASYLWGESALARGGTLGRSLAQVDVGYGSIGGGYVGYRRLSQSIGSSPDPLLAGHTVADPVLGFFVHTRSGSPGLVAGIEVAFGLHNILSMNDERRGYRSPSIFEAAGHLGYRFTGLPVTLRVGYGAWSYGKFHREVPLAAYLVSDRTIESWSSGGHGPTLDLAWSL